MRNAIYPEDMLMGNSHPFMMNGLKVLRHDRPFNRRCLID